MADVTIDDLLNINSNQEENALVAIQQNATTFKARTRPNPIFQLNVTSQGQLETKFGTDIEIPDGEAWSIVVDADFTLSKPFKIGLDSSLELYASTTETVLTCTGTVAVFQNTLDTDLIRGVSVHDIIIDGSGTGILFDLVGTGTLLIEKFQVRDFDRLGTTEMAFYGSDGFTVSDINAGWILINPTAATILESSLNQGASLPDVTFISIMTTVASTVTITSAFTFDFNGGASLVFFDPNAPAGSLFSIETSSIPVGDFYQQGTDIAATAAAAASVTETQFDITAHNLTVGQAVVLKDFTTFTGYNGTFFVTEINDANSVDIEVAFLGVDATGTMNAASLDSTDVLVLADRNVASQDSMFTGESGLEIFGSEASSSSLAQDTFEIVTNVAWAFANLERFSEGVVNTGQLVCNDPQVRRYSISYSGTIEKPTGGVTNIGVIFLKNGANVAFNPPHTANAGQVQISGDDIIELTDTDTLDIAVINYGSSATVIDTSQLSLVAKRA